jgi:signal transduction histidine kinase
MFRSLYSKLALVLLGLFVVVGSVLVFVSVRYTELYQQEVNQKLNRTLAELIVSDRIMMRNGLANEPALKDVFSMLMVINPSIEVYLLDPRGKILAFSAEPGRVKRTHVGLASIKKFLEGSESFPILGDDPRSTEGKKIFTVARIPKQGELQGYLYVILGGESYDTVMQKVQQSYILRLSLWVVFLILLVASAAGLLLFSALTRRLRGLDAAMQAYSDGAAFEKLDLPAVRGGTSPDEIDRLVSTFRLMAGRIQEQLASLRQADTLRRELVANISHDLRTPLATLQGYIETLLMRDSILSTEERKRYLEIAIGHCSRLSSLVAGLFDLAKLEARDMNAQAEPFNIGELVQDVVQKFELAAREKGLRISTNAGEGLPFVFADIGLIGRVLENLIDNAIRYTSTEGLVSVVLQALPGAVSVTVSDTGIGIPEEELTHIFDRYYRVDRSRRDSAGHAGLGLAIVKKILELHGSRIEVQSTLNSGTSFTFQLPLHKPRS